jgi:hypothetical protein
VAGLLGADVRVKVGRGGVNKHNLYRGQFQPTSKLGVKFSFNNNNWILHDVVNSTTTQLTTKIIKEMAIK